MCNAQGIKRLICDESARKVSEIQHPNQVCEKNALLTFFNLEMISTGRVH